MFDNTEKFANHVLNTLKRSKHETLRSFSDCKFDADNAYNVWTYNHAMSVVEELIAAKLEQYKQGVLDFD